MCTCTHRYGNPDGRQALEVSIGLPVFLSDKANRPVLLVFYLVVLVVLIPGAVYMCARGAALLAFIGSTRAISGVNVFVVNHAARAGVSE